MRKLKEEYTEVNIEELLIRDIKEYSKLFPAHPKPTAEMILVWAEDIYGYKHNYKHNIKDRTKWARGLIKQALNRKIKGEKRVYSNFVLYGQRANEISIPSKGEKRFYEQQFDKGI